MEKDTAYVQCLEARVNDLEARVNDLWWYRDHWWHQFDRLKEECSEPKTVRVSTGLSSVEQWAQAPESKRDGWSYPTHCPCCKRPIDVTVVGKEEPSVSSSSSPSTTQNAKKYAYCAVIWGANLGYTLGALVLGQQLKNLKSEHDCILLHTDDVPENFLDVLRFVWGTSKVQEVEYIDAVDTVYMSKGNAFDGVFTKLSAWMLTGYDKVLLMDVDTIPLHLPDSLFELEAPAALVRGPTRVQHGSKVDGRRFFAGEPKAATGAAGANKDEWAWHTQGGINAGVILLQPNENTFQAMRLELMSEHHPEHLPSTGPEQDYLTRFFASAPWHALDCKWNYQPHHVYVTDSGGFAVLYCF
jgi:hypothetical protein